MDAGEKLPPYLISEILNFYNEKINDFAFICSLALFCTVIVKSFCFLSALAFYFFYLIITQTFHHPFLNVLSPREVIICNKIKVFFNFFSIFIHLIYLDLWKRKLLNDFDLLLRNIWNKIHHTISKVSHGEQIVCSSKIDSRCMSKLARKHNYKEKQSEKIEKKTGVLKITIFLN